MLAFFVAVVFVSSTGRVVEQTNKRVYLNAGKDEGLAAGQTVKVTRQQKAVATCTLTEVGDHRSVSVCPDAKVGDTFAIPQTTRTHNETAEKAIAPTTEETLSAFAATPVDRVAFHGMSGGSSRRLAADISIGHTSYLREGTHGYHQERLDIDMRALRLGVLGAQASARASLVAWSSRPQDARFRADARVQLYVWEAEVATREIGRQYTVAIGRLWPYHLPGLASLDGAQAGYRSKDGTTEVGAYAGLRPDPLTTAPSLERWSGGAYYALAFRKSRTLVLHEARLGVRNLPGVGLQLEAEAVVQADPTKWLSFGAGARAAIDAFKTPAFDNARAHVTVRPLEELRGTFTFRYMNRIGEDLEPALIDTVVGPGPRLYATGDIDYRPSNWVTLSANGFATAATVEQTQRYGVGPQVGFPSAFGKFGGLTLAHREEFGWLAGRTSWLSALVLPRDGIRVMARASYNATASPISFAALQHEVAMMGFVDASILQMLSLRATLVGRMSVPNAHLNGLAQLDIVGVF